MLLLQQTGSVRVGEVVRYTVTYTPSLDRILPPPSHLHKHFRDTAKSRLDCLPQNDGLLTELPAAYLHGPYTLYVSCCPSTFDPNKKHVTAEEEGEPDYEPQLKAGGSWSSKLTVPESVRQNAGLGIYKDGEPRKSFTWIIEIASQVLFSTTAAVHYELLVGRDEKSVSLGFSGAVSSQGAPGRLEDHQMCRNKPHVPAKGVFTKAVKLKVEDTTSLWSTPAFPSFDDNATQRTDEARRNEQKAKENEGDGQRPRKRRKIHLVIITHGLHSNLGADMLYMKESIDATAKKAREDARIAKQELRQQRANEKDNFSRDAVDRRAKSAPELAIASTPSFDGEGINQSSDDEDDDEQVLVRGFNGNAVRTERGIQYLGKRLAKYVLSLTYPDQPYLPVKSTITQSISRTFTGAPKPTQTDKKHPSHKNGAITKDETPDKHNLAYQVTSISFVGHSLGGLVQTYAVAYIQKHSPEFFDRIKPINFVALATPFLGLSNENPMYVKFALDFGLVGRTGQDLGLTWRAPTIARSGWGAMVGPFTSGDDKSKEQDPGAKPILRILPTGPAHVALKRFRNRSVYSNVVNDGIVPLRTSCLLFLDWRGLGRVEKARRENGLVGTMVNWGLNELTGQNASTPRRGFFEDLFSDSGDEVNKPKDKRSPDPGSRVPQAEASSGLDQEHYDADDEGNPKQSQMLKPGSPENNSSANFWSSLTSFFRPQAGTPKHMSPKQQKILRRGQTMSPEQLSRASTADGDQEDGIQSSPNSHRKLLVRGSSLYTNNSDNENLEAPPKTTVFESAGDLLNPPLPPKEFLIDPEARPRTIFHDRVYHPEDIPPPPVKRQKTFMRSRPSTGDGSTPPNQTSEDMSKIGPNKPPEQGAMRIEEKIARAYHKDMAWRKVLVRLEPDAHNNIIVRRMFANAYGWPVVKHMCDTHFGYTTAATTKDQDEAPIERAKPQDAPVGKEGERVRDQTQPPDGRTIVELEKAKIPATVDDMPEKEDHEIDTLHLRQKNLQAIKQAETSKTREARSPSELRESRDRVSDLVSLVSAQGEASQSFSSMHSGTAALHRLARQDSARWSDRFFESSDDDDDEDEADLNAELAKAYDRGRSQDELGSSPQSTRSGRSSRGRAKQTVGKGVLFEIDSASKMVAEPDEVSRRNSRESAVSAGYPDLPTLGLTGVGLGRDVRSSFISDGRTSTGEEGISEQVARVTGDNVGEIKKPELGDAKKTLD